MQRFKAINAATLLQRTSPAGPVRCAAILVAALVSGVSAEPVLQEGDLLAISTSGDAQVLSIDVATGAREQLFSFSQLGDANRVGFQTDYVGVTPRGRLLLQGRSYDFPSGPVELYELALETMALTRVSRILEERQEPLAPASLYNLLDGADDAHRVAIEPDGQVLVLNQTGSVIHRFNPITHESSLVRGAFGTQLPQTLSSLTVTTSGKIISSAWSLGETPAEDTLLVGGHGAFPVATPDDRVASFAEIEPDGGQASGGFITLDVQTGVSQSLTGFGDFVPVESPRVTEESIGLEDFVVKDDTVYFAGRGELWSKPIEAETSTRIDNPVAIPDPTINRLVLVPALLQPGDFNGDGAVDVADYTVWRDNLGTDHRLANAGDDDGSSRGIVDLADYQLWRDAYATASTPAAASAIPEPTTAALTCLALLPANYRIRNKN